MRSLLSVFSFSLVVSCSLAWSATESVSSPASTPSKTVQRLVTALNERDAAELQDLIDIDALAERAIRGIDFSEDELSIVMRGMRQARDRVSGNVLAMLRQHNSRVRHLRTEDRGTAKIVLLRFDYVDDKGAPAGTDYVEYELGVDGRIADWYSYVQAERVSEVTGRLLALAMPREGLLAKVFGITQVDSELTLLLRRIQEEQRAGDFVAAYESLGELPVALRETRLWATMRVSVATSANDELRRESLRHLFENFGNDPDLQFLLIDYYFENDQFAAMVAGLESFERSVVEDEVTSKLRCLGEIRLTRWKQARDACLRSLEIEPAQEGTWWMLADIGRQTGDADLVLTTLAGYERQFEVQFNPDLLVEDEAYAWLKSKPEFKKWAALRRD